MPAKYQVDNKHGLDSGYVNATFRLSSSDLSDPNNTALSSEYLDVGDVDNTKDSFVKNGNAEVKNGSKGQKDDETKKKKPDMVGIGETFRFSTTKDKLLMLMGLVCACAHGSSMPVMMVLFGNMTDLFIDTGTFANMLEEWMPTWQEQCQNITQNITVTLDDPCENVTTEYILDDPNPIERFFEMCTFLQMPVGCAETLNSSLDSVPDLMTEMSKYAVYYAILGACVLLIGYLQMLGWQTAAYNQAYRIRKRLFWSILRHEISWFDTHEIGELNTRLSDDITKFERGVGDKLGLFFQWTSAFVAGLIIGFIYGWKLTLVILAVSPLLILAGGITGKMGSAMTSKELKAYAKAGAVAEEVFGAIRTVVAFGGEQKECNRYNEKLVEAKDFGIKKGLFSGLSVGFIFLVMFCSYALAFWYGSKLVYDNEITPGNLLIVFFCVLVGTFSIGNATPNVQEFANARGAAYAIWHIIDFLPKIDSTSTAGKRPENLKGNVEFRNIHFNYPSRPDVKVLQGFNMKIQVGQTVALVGPSGCGKSTTVQLLQRFYDPDAGEVLIDGINIKEMNVKWLRQQIGIVSQEPVLFDTTIAENIRFGKDDVTMEDIARACKEANAQDFISNLPKQHDTVVGGRGAQLSGGQKQRIAIARALVRNPKILLLDEATSALDTESEATVQEALDKVRQGRTTLVIAHRLSTVRTADVIVGLKNGVAIEEGTHNELMAKQGLYYELVMNQQSEYEDIDITESEKLAFTRTLSARNSGKFARGMSAQSSVSQSHPLTEKEDKLPDPPISRIMSLNKPEVGTIIFGCFCALVVGAIQPAFAVIFSEILGVYAEPDKEEAQKKVNLYSGMFAVIGVIAGLGMLGQVFAFSRSGEYLTLRLRKLSFRSLLKMEIAYFDDHSNSVGAICTRLATDASAVQGATGSRLGTVFQAISSIGVGIIIGFVYSWEMTLLLLAFAPLVLVSGSIEMRVLSGNSANLKKAYEAAGKVAVEAIENIRTVAALTKEERFYQDYCREIHQPHQNSLKKVHVQGIAYSFSQAVMFFSHSAGFYFGAWLVENRGLAFDDMFKVFSAIVFGAMAVGQASSFAPDYGKAKVSAAKIFQLLDRTPPIDSSDPSGLKLSECSGCVELRNVYFNYPTRPGVSVLKGLALKVKPGQNVALVGASGCGKSTTVQLIERFYDPIAGEVVVEGKDIRELNLQWLRRQIGIVSQEPVLFDASIRDNIAYGDNSREVSMTEIIEAARNANIHGFIESLPQGYDTNVGDKGTQLSGGQKQRVAIARALIRNPKILLLDEATSALDTESEKIVQAALDRAQEGRTSIVIAHRLSTIQNADLIVVIHHGRIVEMGTHSELIQQRGHYYKLNNSQLSTN